MPVGAQSPTNWRQPLSRLKPHIVYITKCLKLCENHAMQICYLVFQITHRYYCISSILTALDKDPEVMPQGTIQLGLLLPY